MHFISMYIDSLFFKKVAMEGTVEHYMTLLETIEDPAKLLASFYCELHSIQNCLPLIIQFKKLVKLYGRHRVFMAVVDTTSIVDFKAEQPYGIINHICKNSLFNKLDVVIPIIELDEMKKKLTKKPVKIMIDPFAE